MEHMLYNNSWLIIAVALLTRLQPGQAVGPLRVYAKGYNRHNLPSDGGWTQWFNVDHPYDGSEDEETVSKIRYIYGTGCDGIPCKRPLAMKVMSVLGFTPKEEGNEVWMRAHKGLVCDSYLQRYTPCVDYTVRFFCPHMRSTCRRRKWLADKRAKHNKKKMDRKHWNEVNET